MRNTVCWQWTVWKETHILFLIANCMVSIYKLRGLHYKAHEDKLWGFWLTNMYCGCHPVQYGSISFQNVCRMITFYFLNKHQGTVFLFKATFWLSAGPGLHDSVPSLSSYIRGRAAISHTTIFPHRPTHLLSFSPGTGLICGPRVQRGIEGERIGANWKEGGNMKGRIWREKEEGRMQGRGGQETETATRVKQWSGCSCSRLGRGRRSAKTWREQERMGGNERGSPWP